MSAIAVSRRYATALFDLSREGVDLAAGLSTLAEVVSVKEVQDFLDLPNCSPEQKVKVLKKVTGPLSAELVRLVSLLCERGKASLLPEINELFEEMVRADEESVVATVVVAARPDAETKKKIQAAVAAVAGKKVQLEIVEDRQLLGGMVVNIGDRQIDCSLRGKLEGLRKAIAA
ncbi:MAG: ATP synthase F1 subunit delta [Mariprofundaceae bacterium]|nr:ATP synthase F1 subunit delta [Mariprofundaceae bacterium]